MILDMILGRQITEWSPYLCLRAIKCRTCFSFVSKEEEQITKQQTANKQYGLTQSDNANYVESRF